MNIKEITAKIKIKIVHHSMDYYYVYDSIRTQHFVKTFTKWPNTELWTSNSKLIATFEITSQNLLILLLVAPYTINRQIDNEIIPLILIFIFPPLQMLRFIWICSLRFELRK